MIHGIDVSSYQPGAYDTSGLSFVFVKATESTSYVSPEHAAQVAHGRSAGLVVGHYHFLHSGNAVAQADYFLAHAGVKPGDMVACDWEKSGVSQADRDAWMKHVKSKLPDNKVVLYCDLSFWKGVDTESYAGDGLWIADPSAPAGKPRVTHAWVFHQYSSASGLDRNLGNFASTAALKAWAAAPVVKKPAPTPAPKPVTKPVTKPAPKPVVHLANVVYSAQHDPTAAQGHAAHPNDVKPVELALHAEGLLPSRYDADGSFGSLTVKAYGEWQKKCGYTGSAANGIPGHTSLVKLGEKHGFTVS